jgi:hypothetical protein
MKKFQNIPVEKLQVGNIILRSVEDKFFINGSNGVVKASPEAISNVNLYQVVKVNPRSVVIQAFRRSRPRPVLDTRSADKISILPFSKVTEVIKMNA